MKTALITGVTGQDGLFLAGFLLDKGYDVHGTIRRSSVDYRERIAQGKQDKLYLGNFHRFVTGAMRRTMWSAVADPPA